MMSKGGSSQQTKSDREVLGWSTKVEKALAGEEYALGFYLPDFSEDGLKRWPGPIGYRVALNHFVAVATRVHSVFPSAPFEYVTGLVARVVMVPILAHNLTFLARANPKVFTAIVGGRKGSRRVEGGVLAALSKTGSPVLHEALNNEEQGLYDAWVRLIEACMEFHPDKQEARKCMVQVIELLNEYGDNPVASRLWSMLSIIASGDLTVDELLVSKVISEDKDGRLGPAASRPLVSCARSRFGLLRFSYGMEDQRRLLDENFRGAMEKVQAAASEIRGLTRPDHLDKGKAEKAFGWAYLLSRMTLLGRLNEKSQDWDYVTGKRSSAEVFRECYEAGRRLDDLLSAMADRRFLDSVNEQTRAYAMLALRYLAGYRSNPRFIMDTNESDIAGLIEPMKSKLSAVPEIPKGIISMVAARNSLHQAFRLTANSKDPIVQLDHAITQYAMTLDAILVAGVRFEDDERSPNVAGVMDGEVAAWCLPEMAAALSLRSNYAESKEKRDNIKRLRAALVVLGEAQFGVYFNEEEERNRIERGLKIRCRRKFAVS